MNGDLRRVLEVTRNDQIRYGHLVRMNNDIPVKGEWKTKMQRDQGEDRPKYGMTQYRRWYSIAD